MTIEDLRELLSSIAEEDAIISTLFSLYIKNKGYSTQILEDIIFYGVKIGWFEIDCFSYLSKNEKVGV